MSKTLKALVKQRAREIHNQNVAISAAGDPSIDPAMRYHEGFKAPLPFPPDTSRRMRRAIERTLVKRMRKAGIP